MTIVECNRSVFPCLRALLGSPGVQAECRIDVNSVSNLSFPIMPGQETLTKIAIWMQLSTPVHSKTISNPSPLLIPKSSIAISASSLLLFTASSLSVGIGPEVRGTCHVSVTPTAFLANLSLASSISMAVTVDAPNAMESEHARRPTAPEPMTQTFGFGVAVKLIRREA